MKLTTITRNAENQLAAAALGTTKRFLSARLDKHREEYLRKLIREVNDLATLYGQLHPVPPPPVATPKPMPPAGYPVPPLITYAEADHAAKIRQMQDDGA